ncbi:MAG: AraC family transcriptional regulator [Bacteroidota bacterium]
MGKGQWMLLRDELNFQVFSDQKANLVNGICVDLNTELLLEASNGIEYCDLLYNLPFQCSSSTIDESKLDFTEPLLRAKVSKQQQLATIQQTFDCIVAFATMIQEMQVPLADNARSLSAQQQLLLKLLRTKDYITHHFQTNFKLDDLANTAGLSKYHLHRLFRVCFGLSPKHLQIQLRMQKAKNLLVADNLPINAIAHQLGYADTPAFSNQFKRYFQQSPRQFRMSL